MSNITQAHADTVLTPARDAARDTDTAVNIAVVDPGGNLKAFTRMDGAWLGSIDISLKKAGTARYLDNGGLITFPGGLPLRSAEGTIIGAIGVSGRTDENDHTVASAGAAAQS